MPIPKGGVSNWRSSYSGARAVAVAVESPRARHSSCGNKSSGTGSRWPPPTISLICELITRCTTAGLRMYSRVSESSSPCTSMMMRPVPSTRSINVCEMSTSVMRWSRS